MWAFDGRAGVREVGRLEQGWAPGMQVFGRVLGVTGVGHKQELMPDCRDAIGSVCGGWGVGAGRRPRASKGLEVADRGWPEQPGPTRSP